MIGREKEKQLDFRIQLMDELIKNHLSEHTPAQATRAAEDEIPLASEHYPVITRAYGDCTYCSDRSQQRKRSKYICAKCGKHLCVHECFAAYHNASVE
jgi:hypothetical protein